MIRRLFPAPLLSAALWALWLVLHETVDPAHLLLGLAVGIAVPLMTASLRPRRVRIRRPLVLARLILVVGHDVIASALEVAGDVLRLDRRPPNSQFVRIPLELRDPSALAALATITTVVPGTVWSELAFDRSVLLLHVWNLGDEAEFVAYFKARYERPLKEIFE